MRWRAYARGDTSVSPRTHARDLAHRRSAVLVRQRLMQDGDVPVAGTTYRDLSPKARMQLTDMLAERLCACVARNDWSFLIQRESALRHMPRHALCAVLC